MDLASVPRSAFKHLPALAVLLSCGDSTPATPATAVEHVLDLVDMVLVMTVNPGFGGQAYISTMESKITQIADLVRNGGHDVDIEVDGGIGPSTIEGAARAGANVLVSGSALYKDPDGLAHAVADLRSRAEAARE